MKRKFLAFLLIFVVISMYVGSSYFGAGVAAGDNSWPIPDESNKPIPAPWPKEPGKMPDLIGGRVPDRPLVFSEPTLDKVDKPSDFAIDVWYDSPQKFGHLGNPQQWVNIVGNVSGTGVGDTLTYKLNNDPVEDLTIGSDGTRLERTGDFNVEIDYDDLKDGNNKVEITASNGISDTTEIVTIDYTTGNTWDPDYTADWGSSTDIQDIAQVVDGYWQLNGDSVRVDPDNWGYDRLLAIGDETWKDYEVTVPITVFGLDPSGFQGASNGPGVGFIMRWQGHNNKDGEQPNGDWQRTGAIGWYRWAPDLTEALELRGYDWRRGTNFNQVLAFNTTYMFKMSVQSIEGQPAYYRIKFWEASEPEPMDWDLQGFSSETASDAGSLLLVAHHVDAKFGEVKVTNLETLRLTVDVDIKGEGEIIFDPDQEDFAYSDRIFVYAIPEFGYDFDRWTGDYTGKENPADFRIYRDMKLTAHFEPKPPTKLKVNIVGNGTVSKNPDRALYPWGEVVELTAVPAGNQIFLRWEGDVTGIQNPSSVTMDEDKEVTAIFGPKSEASPKSDDFSGCFLDRGVWKVVNPAGDATIRTNGKQAKFLIPAGSPHNMWDSNADALRIMQPTNNYNFEVEAKFENLPKEKFQMQGILVQQDDDNWLRFDVYHNGATLLANAAKTIGGVSGNVKFSAIDPAGASKVFIRVERNGDKWTQSYSFDNSNWTTFVVFIQELEVTSSGVFVGNAAQSPGAEPAFTTRLDYFFNTAVPIIPEDQGNTIDVYTVGKGQVQLTPQKSIYTCGEKVKLTATPANNNWLFHSWSGDLSGKQNPATLTITGDHEVTARFSRGAEVYMPIVKAKQ